MFRNTIEGVVIFLDPSLVSAKSSLFSHIPPPLQVNITIPSELMKLFKLIITL